MFAARMGPTQTLVVGASVAIAIWIGEFVAGPTEVRHVIADFGWTGFGLSAAFASGRALFAPIGRDRGGASVRDRSATNRALTNQRPPIECRAT